MGSRQASAASIRMANTEEKKSFNIFAAHKFAMILFIVRRAVGSALAANLCSKCKCPKCVLVV